jgi:hypothetical protein
MITIEPHLFGNRPAVRLANDQIETIIVTGGGHIASVKRADGDVNPLWAPTWPTFDPALRELRDPAVYGTSGEEGLLCSILGHNLCIDVFGFHSQGEQNAGMTLHGESGMVTWDVMAVDRDAGSVMLSAHLVHTAMTVERTFTLRTGANEVVVEESVTSLVGFERAIGRQQHATIGAAFLEPRPAFFSCNADRGVTYPEALSDDTHSYAVNTEFDYPHVPRRDGTTVDWRTYPTKGPSGNLSSLRMNPAEELSWWVATSNAHGLALAYVWEREAFPWLAVWEEDHHRDLPPWNRKEVTRGLEFGSWAYPGTRRKLVEAGTLLDTPAYEWLDAYERKTTRFLYALLPIGEVSEAPSLSPAGKGAVASDDTGWTFRLTDG